ncbi:unnamed protein product [Paramecium pentaurelia]|uniref:C2 NT-type domain-containing protein n=1 Tax=Paramecium pentaurelia TaxID=43138 RepID=A0A8S1WX62_9CILI|nr:unnamed protein product [Paramecium pentaurelia]
MLHLDIEVQTIQFFIGSTLESCSIKLSDSFSNTVLESKVRCKSKEIQEIWEKIELNVQYVEKGNLKLYFYDGQTIFGEATINLGFYIENNLPLIIDKITIQNKFDSEAQVQMSLAWNQLDQLQSKQIRQVSPMRDQPIPTPPPQKPVGQQKKPADEFHFDKRTVHATYTQWKDHQEQVKEQYVKKLKEPIKKGQIEDEKFEDIRKPEVRVMSPRRFQTPKDYKPINKQQIQKSTGGFENLKSSNNNPLDFRQINKDLQNNSNNRAPSKSPNRYDSRVKTRNDVLQATSPNEQSEILKGSTKPKPQSKKGELQENFGTRPTQMEGGLTMSSKQLDTEIDSTQWRQQLSQLQQENVQLKNQIQKLSNENQGLKDQQIKSEAAFNLLSETYSNLRNEYQRIQVKSFNNSSSHSLLMNKETDHLKRELDQKSKEIEFYKKEAELWKKDLDVTKRENGQIKREVEQFKKDLENRLIDLESQKRDIENKNREIENLEKELQRAQQAIQLIQNDSFRSASQLSGQNTNQEIMEQMKNLIKTKQIEVDSKNEEIKQNKIRIAYLEKELYEKGRRTLDQSEQIKNLSSQLEQENEKLKQQLVEKNVELQSKIQEIERLMTQNNNVFLQSPDIQNTDSNKLLNDYIVQITTLKQENQSLILQNKKDQVKLESLQNQFEITKNIVVLSEQRQQSLEHEILQLEKAVLGGKQNMADVINAVMECGGPQLAEEVERFLITRRSTKVS